jgi:outer membrane protein assembly factor BamE (lipoprotein component of BamABCDE complex)
MKRFSIVALLLVSTVWSGCIPWPLPAPAEKDPTPFTQQDLAFIQPGTTTRAELLERMGEPVVQRRGGSLVVYGAVQKLGMQLVLVITVVPMAGDAAEKPHHLFVWFDNDDVVERQEVIRGDTGCTSDGICIGRSVAKMHTTSWWYLSEERMTEDTLVLYEDAASEEAKRAIPVDDSCLVYVYQRDQFWNRPMYIAFDSKSSRTGVSEEGFVLRECSSGKHVLFAGMSNNVLAAAETQFALECIAGDTFFFEVDAIVKHESTGLFASTYHVVVNISPVAEERAREVLADRTFILAE